MPDPTPLDTRLGENLTTLADWFDNFILLHREVMTLNPRLTPKDHPGFAAKRLTDLVPQAKQQSDLGFWCAHKLLNLDTNPDKLLPVWFVNVQLTFFEFLSLILGADDPRVYVRHLFELTADEYAPFDAGPFYGMGHGEFDSLPIKEVMTDAARRVALSRLGTGALVPSGLPWIADVWKDPTRTMGAALEMTFGKDPLG